MEAYLPTHFWVLAYAWDVLLHHWCIMNESPTVFIFKELIFIACPPPRAWKPEDKFWKFFLSTMDCMDQTQIFSLAMKALLPSKPSQWADSCLFLTKSYRTKANTVVMGKMQSFSLALTSNHYTPPLEGWALPISLVLTPYTLVYFHSLT